MRIKWAIAALEDLESLHAYIAEDNPRAASKMVVTVRTAVVVLRHHPHMGRIGRVEGTREFVIGGTAFIAAYYVEHNLVVIVAIIHSARRWPGKFESD